MRVWPPAVTSGKEAEEPEKATACMGASCSSARSGPSWDRRRPCTSSGESPRSAAAAGFKKRHTRSTISPLPLVSISARAKGMGLSRKGWVNLSRCFATGCASSLILLPLL